MMSIPTCPKCGSTKIENDECPRCGIIVLKYAGYLRWKESGLVPGPPPRGNAHASEPVMNAVKDSSHLYEVERRARHAERPGFRIAELQISPTQQVPWHFHTNVQDTFYVLAGRLRLFLRDPKEEVRLGPGETYAVRPGRPHLVTNGGEGSATFLVLQGIGEYDYVPLT
jgi:quercetin dioxygenase-like cupin family protein